MSVDDPDLEESVAEYREELSPSALPDRVRERAKLVLLDTVGVAIHGSRRTYVADVIEVTERFGWGPGDRRGSTAFATWDTHSPVLAAAANATAASSTEYYEGTQGAGMPGIHVVPAALATAERTDADGAKLLEAIVIGYETAARIGDRLRPMQDDLHGHGGNHPVGVAAAVGHLLGLEHEAFADALRIAAAPFVVGHWNAILEGAIVRNYYSGTCVTHGIRAALLAQAGVTGMSHAVDRCLIRNLRDPGTGAPNEGPDPAFGREYFLTRNLFKMYPCCRYTHAPLEAFREARAGRDIDPAEVARITVRASEFATYGDIQRPRNAIDAKYSIPFVLAADLVLGAVDVDAFSPASVADEDVLEVAEWIDVVADPEYEAHARNGRWGAAVEIELRSGEHLGAGVTDASSGVDVSRSDIVEKFDATLERSSVPVDPDAIREAFLSVESVDSIRPLFAPDR